MQKELATYDKSREELIKKSRDVLKMSKLIIYAVHKEEINKADKLRKDIQKEKQALDKITKKAKGLEFEGSYKAAVSEYVEAILYLDFTKTGKLTKINCNPTHYLLGLADLPGELVRRAVFQASKGNSQEVERIRQITDKIYGEMLSFNFGNGELRKKTDGIKYSLQKLENLQFELAIRNK